MIGTVVWNGSASIGQLPGNEDPALAANFHAGKPLVEAGNRSAHSLVKWKGLYIAQFGLAVIAQHGFAVFVPQRRPGMVAG